MYVHLGGDVTISLHEVVAMVDLATMKKEDLEGILKFYRRRGLLHQVVATGLKSLVFCTDRVFLSPISSVTLKQRAGQFPT